MRLQPKAGRIAFICGHKDHKKEGAMPPPRQFVKPDDPQPSCHLHGKMELQENAPYFGQPIPDAIAA